MQSFCYSFQCFILFLLFSIFDLLIMMFSVQSFDFVITFPGKSCSLGNFRSESLCTLDLVLIEEGGKRKGTFLCEQRQPFL